MLSQVDGVLTLVDTVHFLQQLQRDPQTVDGTRAAESWEHLGEKTNLLVVWNIIIFPIYWE